MSYVTNLALWLQYFNKLTYLLTYNTNRKGTRVSPCRMPLLTWNGSVCPSDVRTIAVVSVYNAMMPHISRTP